MAVSVAGPPIRPTRQRRPHGGAGGRTHGGQRGMGRHRGRRPRVPGGRPYKREITLSLEDGAALVAAAAVAEMADAAYAAEVIHRHLALRAGLVPADWQQVLGELIRHRAELAELRADV